MNENKIFKTQEILGYRIATQHNLSFYNNLILDAIEAINNNNFDIACIIITAISNDRELARDKARKTLAFYSAVGNIYSKFLSSHGFRNEIEEITESYKKKGLVDIHKLIPDKMLDAITITGEPEECKKKINKFIRTGISLPVIQFNPVNEAEYSFKDILETFME